MFGKKNNGQTSSHVAKNSICTANKGNPAGQGSHLWGDGQPETHDQVAVYVFTCENCGGSYTQPATVRLNPTKVST
jgi:hypothetical protein